MCRRVDCPKCSRPTYSGCGAHIEQVLGDVPATERCRCREKRAAEATSTAQPKPTSWLGGLLGK